MSDRECVVVDAPERAAAAGVVSVRTLLALLCLSGIALTGTCVAVLSDRSWSAALDNTAAYGEAAKTQCFEVSQASLKATASQMFAPAQASLRKQTVDYLHLAIVEAERFAQFLEQPGQRERTHDWDWMKATLAYMTANVQAWKADELIHGGPAFLAPFPRGNGRSPFGGIGLSVEDTDVGVVVQERDLGDLRVSFTTLLHPTHYEGYGAGGITGVADLRTGLPRMNLPPPLSSNETLLVGDSRGMQLSRTRPRLYPVGTGRFMMIEEVGMYLGTAYIRKQQDPTDPNRVFEMLVLLPLTALEAYLVGMSREFCSDNQTRIDAHQCLAPRFYMSVRDFWAPHELKRRGDEAWGREAHTHTLVAASHGGSYKQVNMTGVPFLLAKRIDDVEAADPVIARVARHVRTLPSGYESVAGNEGFLIDRVVVDAATNASEEYFIGVSEVTLEEGIDWWLTIASATQPILSKIEAKQAQLETVISAERARVQRGVEESRAVMYAIVAALLLVLGAAALAAANAILRPMLEVQQAMQRVAHMDLDHLATEPTSLMTEVHQMQRDFATMVANLIEFRSFLPDASLHGHEAAPSVRAPTGTVALAFSDIVGSTQLWEAVPEEMAEALDKHNACLRAAIRKYRGYEVKTIGDAFMVAFQDPVDAYRYSIEVQAELTKQLWPEALCQFPNTRVEKGAPGGGPLFAGIQVRVGLHYGECECETNPLTGRMDYRGGAVNKAARIEPQALHGMTAFSKELKDALCGAAGGAIYPLGTRDLKGIGQVDLYYGLHADVLGRHAVFQAALAAGTAAGPAAARLPSRDPTLSPRPGGSFSCGSSVASKSEKGFAPAARKAAAGAAHLERNLKRERGGVAKVVFTGLHEVMAGFGHEPGVVLRAVNTSIQAVLDAAAMTEGKVEWTNDSSVLLSWGLSSRVAQPAAQGLRFIGALKRREVRTTVGAVFGPYLHGNVGTSTRRYHTILGAGCQYVHRLPPLCASYGVEALAVMAGGLPPALGAACEPLDVLDVGGGERDYGPCAVLEHPIAAECAALTLSWDEGREDVDAHLGPAHRFRAAVQAAIRAGAALDAGAAGVDLDALPAPLQTLWHTLARRGAAIGGGAPQEWSPQPHAAVSPRDVGLGIMAGS